MAETSTLALGATITIDGTDYHVHQDCREIRKGFELWLRKEALDALDAMQREGVIASREEKEFRKEKTFERFQAKAFAYGSENYAIAATSDEGIKQLLYLRIKIKHPTVALSLVEKYVDEKGWKAAQSTFAEADGYSPKSAIPEAGAS